MNAKISRIKIAVADLDTAACLYGRLFDVDFEPTGDAVRAATGTRTAIAWNLGIELVQPIPGRDDVPACRAASERLGKLGEGAVALCFEAERIDDILAAAANLALPHFMPPVRLTTAQIEREMGGRFSAFEEHSFAFEGFSLSFMACDPKRKTAGATGAPRLFRAAAAVRDLSREMVRYERLFDTKFDVTGAYVAQEHGNIAAICWDEGFELAQPVPGSDLPPARMLADLLHAHGEGILSGVFLVEDPCPILDRARSLGIPQLTADPLDFGQELIDSELGGRFTQFREWVLAPGAFIVALNVVKDKPGWTAGRQHDLQKCL